MDIKRLLDALTTENDNSRLPLIIRRIKVQLLAGHTVDISSNSLLLHVDLRAKSKVCHNDYALVSEKNIHLVHQMPCEGFSGDMPK